jgi:oligoendopeptidase F
MWEDNDDDFSEDGEEHNKDYFQRLRESQKEMLKIDLVRGADMPMSYEEWVELFGTPTEEDLRDITQAYINHYHRHGDEYISMLVSAFDIEWVNHLLSYNEYVEEYELCAIIKSHLDIYHNEESIKNERKKIF